jgi:hypothetical protein
MKYFHECTTIDEVKATYKKLAMQHHPDRGGDTATMQAINTEYAFACARILNGNNTDPDTADEQMKESTRYREVLEKIINIPGITIELVGLWIWVSGNTKAVKEELKAAGFFYASKKMMWYYRPAEMKVLHGGQQSMDEIRAKYGSEKVNPTRRKVIED